MGEPPDGEVDAGEQKSGARRVWWAAKRRATRILLPQMQRAARAWVSGETVGDAMSVAARLAAGGTPSTLGMWGVPEDPARRAADEYLRAMEYLVASGLDCYLSIKSPDLRYDLGLAAELAAASRSHGISLHLDSHGSEVAETDLAMADTMLRHVPGEGMGMTLPGRWSRSLNDGDWAAERGVRVRVVKGQWADPADPGRDPRAGFLEVIDRLAGRARLVAVATHDIPLGAEAIARLRRAGTRCELELLFGLPMSRSLAWAAENGVAVRVYVPYGKGYLPHALSQLRRNPRFVWWIISDLLIPGSPARRPS